jgi:hypothetical protein
MLEGRLAEPEGGAWGGLAVCHPHPLFGGSMSSALIPALQRDLCAGGIAVLRFNFRGTGRSEGTYDHGRGEVDDAIAAAGEVATSATPVAIAGWSFGAVVATHAAIREPAISCAVAIAMPLATATNIRSPEAPSPAEMRRWGKPLLMITGSADQIADPSAAAAWAREAGGSTQTIDGAEHLFAGHAGEVAALVLAFLRSALGDGQQA